jgi:hypothetical protein
MAAIVGVKRDPVGNVMVLDQTRLPKEEKWLSLSSAEDVSAASPHQHGTSSRPRGLSAHRRTSHSRFQCSPAVDRSPQRICCQRHRSMALPVFSSP